MSNYYIDADGNRRRKPPKFRDMPEAWIEEPDKDGDTCDEKYIDERNLLVRCGRFAVQTVNGDTRCRRHAKS